ncbi:DNA repair protein rhp54 [Hordeum vulgare]|nr:DNA repair protein rhp54 [Hordeum vulgare]
MEALLYLGLNPGQHGLVNAIVPAANTSLSAFPWMALPESPRASTTHPIPVFLMYPQASHLSDECSTEVSAMAPSMPAHIDLSTTLLADGSSSGGTRTHAWEMSADMFSGIRNLFDRMPTTIDNERANHFIESIIFKGVPAVTGGVVYDIDETQSQDGRDRPFTPPAYDQAGMHPTFVQDQVGLDLDDFSLDHVFLEDYGLEEEDEVDIDEEPLFKDELASQAAGVQPKRKSRRTKA